MLGAWPERSRDQQLSHAHRYGVQEYDNAALVMMAHSPVAWEHVQFKDVAVKVSNVEVYYRAVSFYLEQHPDLLVDLLKVRGAQPLHHVSVPSRHRSAAKTAAGTESGAAVLCHSYLLWPLRLSQLL